MLEGIYGTAIACGATLSLSLGVRYIKVDKPHSVGCDTAFDTCGSQYMCLRVRVHINEQLT